MSTIKKLTLALLLALFLANCSSENDMMIEKGRVGKLNHKTTIQDLQEIFSKDSIVSTSPNIEANEDEELFSISNEYLVYNSEGKKLLEIEPTDETDSLSTIKSVQIFDSNFKTEKGISLESTFREIIENYDINKVETSLTSATLFIDELNATIAIDKKELGINQFSREQVTIDQIPDIARIKFFTVWFN